MKEFLHLINDTLSANKTELEQKLTKLESSKSHDNKFIKNSVAILREELKKVDENDTNKKDIIDRQIIELEDMSSMYQNYLKNRMTIATNKKLKTLFEEVYQNLKDGKNIGDEKDKIEATIDAEGKNLEDTILNTSTRDFVEKMINFQGLYRDYIGLETAETTLFLNIFTIEYINILDKNNRKENRKGGLKLSQNEYYDLLNRVKYLYKQTTGNDFNYKIEGTIAQNNETFQEDQAQTKIKKQIEVKQKEESPIQKENDGFVFLSFDVDKKLEGKIDSVFLEKSQFEKRKNGKFSKKEEKERITKVSDDITLFQDLNQTKYLIQDGDTLYSIRNKLAKLPQFKYLTNQQYSSKLFGFNIPPKILKPNTWLPIPINADTRIYQDKTFSYIIYKGVYELQNDKVYGKKASEIINKVGFEKLVSLLLSIAKQESGGKPIGQYVLHRYEPKYDCYSYSHFHILMDSWGINARKKLGLTEGQLQNPINGAMLTFAFLIEKGFDFEQLFDGENINSIYFSKLYNGSAWEKNNYANQITNYYDISSKVVKKKS